MSTTTSPAITKADKNAIRDLVALAQDSQNDPEALMTLHTAETVIVNLAGRRVLGRETYSKAMADALASPLSDVLTTAEIVDLRLATPDVAIVSATKTVHDGVFVVGHGRNMVAQGQGWRKKLAFRREPVGPAAHGLGSARAGR